MKTLNDLNMQYVDADENEQIEGGAILQCSKLWTKEKLQEWLPDYDFDMIQTVQQWLSDNAYIAEGLYFKVWLD